MLHLHPTFATALVPVRPVCCPAQVTGTMRHQMRHMATCLISSQHRRHCRLHTLLRKCSKVLSHMRQHQQVLRPLRPARPRVMYSARSQVRMPTASCAPALALARAHRKLWQAYSHAASIAGSNERRGGKPTCLLLWLPSQLHIDPDQKPSRMQSIPQRPRG